MRHKRQLDKNFYKEWCPEITLIEKCVLKTPVISGKRIDLHGLTLNEAYFKSLSFIEESYYKNFKVIFIITGASGSIKKEFTSWISFNNMISKYELVKNGEFKIWLKKQK